MVSGTEGQKSDGRDGDDGSSRQLKIVREDLEFFWTTKADALA